jgi:hypothetical protein
MDPMINTPLTYEMLINMKSHMDALLAHDVSATLRCLFVNKKCNKNVYLQENV